MGKASSTIPHRWHDCLNHLPCHPSMEKVSSTKPVPGAKNVRDRCVKWLWPGYEGELSEARSKGLRD